MINHFAVIWTPEQWAGIISIIGLQIIGAITAWRNGGRTQRNSEKIDSLHHEVRPPSNGTTAGALQEFTAAWVPWVYEELSLIGKKLGVEPHAPPPSLPQVTPPDRPTADNTTIVVPPASSPAPPVQ